MTVTKLSSGTLAATALLLVSLGTATVELSRLRSADADLALAHSAASALSDHLHTLETQTTTAENEAATLREKLNATNAASAGAASAQSSSAGATVPVDLAAAGTAFMQRHPAVRQALADWFDGRTNYRFSAFYEQAGLTADQIREFLALNRQGSFGMGLGPTSPALQFRLMPTEEWPGTDGKIAALLGPEKYQQYQRYLSTLPAREFTGQLASALAFSSEPLSATQFDQFTQALVSSGAVQSGRTGPAYNWTTIANSAAPVLSGAQRDALSALRARAEFDAAFSHAADAANSSSP
jgi:hypothetical protein